MSNIGMEAKDREKMDEKRQLLCPCIKVKEVKFTAIIIEESLSIYTLAYIIISKGYLEQGI